MSKKHRHAHAHLLHSELGKRIEALTRLDATSSKSDDHHDYGNASMTGWPTQGDGRPNYVRKATCNPYMYVYCGLRAKQHKDKWRGPPDLQTTTSWQMVSWSKWQKWGARLGSECSRPASVASPLSHYSL